MLTENLLACVGKRVNVMIGHGSPQLLQNVLLREAAGSFIEVDHANSTRRIPLGQVRSIELSG